MMNKWGGRAGGLKSESTRSRLLHWLARSLAVGLAVALVVSSGSVMSLGEGVSPPPPTTTMLGVRAQIIIRDNERRKFAARRAPIRSVSCRIKLAVAVAVAKAIYLDGCLGQGGLTKEIELGEDWKMSRLISSEELIQKCSFARLLSPPSEAALVLKPKDSLISFRSIVSTFFKPTTTSSKQA